MAHAANPSHVELARVTPENARSRNGGRRYSDEEIETALTVLAYESGNAARASRTLAALGRPVPESRLRLWRSRMYADRYRAIEADEVPKRYARIAEQCEAVAEDLGQLECQLADQVRDQAAELAPRDAAGALRNVSVAKGVNVDKASVIRGRPTEIKVAADATEILKTIAKKHPSLVKIRRRLRVGSVGRLRHPTRTPRAKQKRRQS